MPQNRPIRRRWLHGLFGGTPFGAAAGALGLGGTLAFRHIGGALPGALAFLGLAGILVTVPFLVHGLTTSARWTPAGVLAGALPVAVLLYAGGGEGARAMWTAAHDRPAGAGAVGSWQTGDTVIRARPDKVTGHRLSDGAVTWEWAPPGRNTVCTMSRGTSGGIGLVGHAPEGGPCATAVALDLTTGTARWSTRYTAEVSGLLPTRHDLIAAGDGLAVVPTRTGWRALGLPDGEQRWRTSAGPGCTPLLAHLDTPPGPAGRPVVTLADCGDRRAPVLRTHAPGSGRVLTRTALPAVGPPEHAAVLSARPLTVWLQEHESRGTHAVLSYDDRGRPLARIPAVAPGHEIRVVPSVGELPYRAFPARPARAGVVVGDTLVALGVRPGDDSVNGTGKGASRHTDGRLVAYSLRDGRHLWTAGLDDHLHALATDADGAVWALSSNRLLQVEPATGLFLHELDVHDLEPDRPVDLWVGGGGRYTVVFDDGTGDDAPVGVLETTAWKVR
ncbi:PQQ-binding-like beta-propeller repeat protein [Streptomyces sp. TRM49041]|uniref:outer membrane protein assembly factor BamB family protein n=1 Tax=Streptomyces sp. TRM49041 TaxID=2603216 RepID=UPI0011EFB0B6|nr:PQQ-binding-like beta-propeller repeat protein [Streptomyces sp. TRM49041]